MIKRNRYGVIAITVWLVCLLSCGLIISRTTFTADLSAFLPKDPTPEQQLLMDQIRDGLASRLILVGIEGSDASQRAALSTQMAQQLRSSDLFVTVNNGEPVHTEQDQAYLFNHRYLLSPAVNEQHFSEAGLRDSIGESIALLASPAGLLVKSMLPNDPTGEMMALLHQFNSQQQPNLVDGVWASANGQRALMLLQTSALGSDTDAQQHAMQAITHAYDQAKTALSDGTANAITNTQLLMTGPGVFSVNTRETIKTQVVRISLISITLITTILLLAYRSVLTLALGLLPVLTGALVGIAAVSIGFGTVHGITLGFGTALIGEAVDYSIYLFIQSAHIKDQHQSWLKRFWPTIRLGVLTSICGFASLLFSGFPGLAQLGLYAITGLVTAALMTRFVLPNLLPQQLQVYDTTTIGKRMAGLVKQAYQLRWLAAVLLCTAVVVLINQRDHIWSQEIASLSPVSKVDIALDTSLRADVNAPDARYLIVATGNSKEQVLQRSEKVAALLQPLVESGTIASFESASRYLPSEATQRTRQASLPDLPTLESNLLSATADLPVKASLFTPFLKDIESARQLPLIDIDQLKNTSMAMAVDALLLQQADRWTALLPLTAPKDKEIDAVNIQQTLYNSQLSDVVFVDMKLESDHLYASYLAEAIQLSLYGLIAIVLLLLLTFRSIARVLHILLPLAAAVITVTAGLALLGQQLIILHLIGLLLVVAVGSNYALFFSQSDTGSLQHSPRILTSMMLANLTTVIGFGLLAFSKVSILQAMGSTVAPGVMMALLFSIIFAKKAHA